MRSALRLSDLHILRKLLFVALGILILGLGIGVGSTLSIPGVSDTRAFGGTHYACVKIYTSEMRYAQSPAQCTQGEYSISWTSQAGPSFSGYERIQSDIVPVAVGETEIHRLSCPDGKQVLGGGGVASFTAESPPVAEPNMFWSFPFDEDSWQIAVYNDTAQAQEMRAYAICASVIP